MPSVLFDSVFVCADPKEALRYCVKKGIPTDWYGKPNSFRMPRGQAPGRGWVLLSRAQLLQTDYNAAHTLTFTNDNGTFFAFDDLVLVRSKCITTGAFGDPAALHLVELADRRWNCHNETYSSPLFAHYNVWARGTYIADVISSGQFYADSINSGTGLPWTWQEMLDDIWSHLPSRMGSSPVLPFTPDGQPWNFHFEDVSAWRSYNQVLLRLGCAFCLTPGLPGGQIAQIGSPNVLTTLAAQTFYPIRIWDSESAESDAGRIPQQVKVHFQKQSIHTGLEDTTDTATTKQWSIQQVYTLTRNNVNTTEFVPETVASVWDDTPALLDENGDLTNSTDLESRADERAADYFRMTSGISPTSHIIYSGYINHLGFICNSLVAGYTCFDIGDGAGFEIIQRNLNLRVQDDGSFSDIPPDEDILPNLRPPKIGRADLPLYPPQTQILRITDSTALDSTNLFPAEVLYRDPTSGSYISLEPCLYTPLDGTSTPPSVGDIFMGKLSGGYEDSPTIYPIYVGVKAGAGGGGGSLTVEGINPGSGDVENTIPDCIDVQFDEASGLIVEGIPFEQIATIVAKPAALNHAGTLDLTPGQYLGSGYKFSRHGLVIIPTTSNPSPTEVGLIVTSSKLSGVGPFNDNMDLIATYDSNAGRAALVVGGRSGPGMTDVLVGVPRVEQYLLICDGHIWCNRTISFALNGSVGTNAGETASVSDMVTDVPPNVEGAHSAAWVGINGSQNLQIASQVLDMEFLNLGFFNAGPTANITSPNGPGAAYAVDNIRGVTGTFASPTSITVTGGIITDIT